MSKHKVHPRVLSAGELPRPNNIFYRLFSNQRFLAIISLCLLGLIIFPIAKTYTQKRLMEKEINDIKAEIDSYQKTNQELKEMISYLESDQSLEEQARLNLNLKRPGEKVIVIDNSKNIEFSTETAESAITESNLKKWWRYFFINN